MSSKSEINQLSKKEILSSLLSQQQQSSATINRLLVALALAAKISPQDLAKYFADAEAGQKYAGELNIAIDAAISNQLKQQDNSHKQDDQNPEPNAQT